VYGEAQVYGEARVYGKSQVSGEARVNFDTTETKWIVVGQFGEYGRYITVTKTGAIFCGCFEGGIEEFENAVSEKYGSDFGAYADCITIIKNYIAQ
jgi:hypothetical protein